MFNLGPWLFILVLAVACARGPSLRSADDDDEAAPSTDDETGSLSEDEDDQATVDAGPLDREDSGTPAPDTGTADVGVAPDVRVVPNPGAPLPFSFLVSNVDATSIDFAAAPDATLDCGASRIDTSGAVRFENWCGTPPTPIIRTQVDGPELVVLPLRSFTLAAASSLRITGARALVLIVQSDATIAGAMDTSADGAIPGAGGDVACGLSTGGDGEGRDGLNGGGGGGGGFGTAGGLGGDDRNSSSAPGAAGVPRGTPELAPLFGGCRGGRGGGCAGDPGAGGGAVQITAGGALRVLGTIGANGGAGAQGCDNDAGGNGGGSGGGILLEAKTIDLTGATVTAAGGNGGPGQRDGEGGAGASTQTANGGAGNEGGGSGAGAGGGGFGRVRLRAETACTGC